MGFIFPAEVRLHTTASASSYDHQRDLNLNWHILHWVYHPLSFYIYLFIIILYSNRYRMMITIQLSYRTLKVNTKYLHVIHYVHDHQFSHLFKSWRKKFSHELHDCQKMLFHICHSLHRIKCYLMAAWRWKKVLFLFTSIWSQFCSVPPEFKF